MTIEEMLKDAQAENKRLCAENARLTEAETNREAVATGTEQPKTLALAIEALADLRGKNSALLSGLESAGIELPGEPATAEQISGAIRSGIENKAKAMGSAEAARITAMTGADAPLNTGPGESKPGDQSQNQETAVQRWTKNFS